MEMSFSFATAGLPSHVPQCNVTPLKDCVNSIIATFARCAATPECPPQGQGGGPVRRRDECSACSAYGDLQTCALRTPFYCKDVVLSKFSVVALKYQLSMRF